MRGFEFRKSKIMCPGAGSGDLLCSSCTSRVSRVAQHLATACKNEPDSES
jgi:hypothetical protein